MEKIDNNFPEVSHNGQVWILLQNLGRCWRAPESGLLFQINPEDGLEYDLTDYIEDEIWIIERFDDHDHECINKSVYASECERL